LRVIGWALGVTVVGLRHLADLECLPDAAHRLQAIAEYNMHGTIRRANDHFLTAVKKVTDIVAEIAAASREQSTGIEQVNRAVTQMDEATQQNAVLVEEAAAASRAIVDQMQALDALISRYQPGNSAERRRAA
jgi:methyl-accepting chemotaxis protein